jgi:hypothetical protein
MTDLRELLREVRPCLVALAQSWQPMDKHKVREILERVDAALAQPPDAKPVFWEPPSDWLKDHEIPPMGSALQKLGSRLADMLQDDDWNNIEQMLFDVARECAAPQPPAGKGQK